MAYVFNMVGGGSGASSAPTKKDVNFFDYDGTLIAGYTIAEAQALSSFPTAPDHSADTTPLTFQSWNYTLSQVNAVTSKTDVGAIYVTTDGKTALHITLTAVTGLSPTLYLYKPDSSTLSVDWGDGNTSTFTNSGNFNTGAHTYSAAGNYIIKLWISSGGGTYGLGGGDYTRVLVGGSSTLYQCSLVGVFIGLNMTTITNYAFYGCRSLLSIAIPSSVTSIGEAAFSICNALTSITIPSSVTSIGTYAFNDCYALASITIPSSITSIGTYAFNYCYALASITIPSSITSIGANTFSYCYALTSITIPSSITSIGANAFYSCYIILEYIMTRSTPPTLSNVSAFTNIVPICKIKVPVDSLAAYRGATNWSTYANYMEGY